MVDFNKLNLKRDISILSKKGIEYVKTFEEYRLERLLKTADDVYYNDGKSVKPTIRSLFSTFMTDFIYDELYEYFKSTYPNNPYSHKVGAPILHASERKVLLPFSMMSLDKIKPDKTDKWINKENNPVFLISEKLDGMSCALIDKDGVRKLYTRGDGKEGQDISHLLRGIKNLPPIEENITVRGELIMPVSIFNKYYADKNPNPRNLVGGLLTRKEVAKELKHVHFVAYSMPTTEKYTPFLAFEYLKARGFLTATHILVKRDKISVDFLTNLFKESRETSIYDVDGIVVSRNIYEKPTDSNPKLTVAFKTLLDEQAKKTTVTKVVWRVSKNGLLKPVVHFTPIVLEGATIQKATGHNAKFICDNGIGKDAIILVSRSGGVIPRVEKVINSIDDPELPTDIPYEWNKSKVEIYCPEAKTLDDVKILRIMTFFKSIGADNLREGTISRIYKSGHTSVSQFFSLDKEDLLCIDGFKEVLAEKMLKNIHIASRTCTMSQVLYGSTCFSRELGVKRMREIMKHVPHFMTMERAEIQRTLSTVNGFGEKTILAFLRGLPKFKKFYSKIENFLEIQEERKETGGKFTGKIFVFSGVRDKDLESLIESNGGTVGSSISLKTSVLIVKDPNSNSSKLNKAKELGITICGIDSFKSSIEE